MICAFVSGGGARADPPPLLAQAVQNWIANRTEWAVTQETRTFRLDGKAKDVRVERYDPSQPDAARWRLVSLNGKPPTPEQATRWERRRNARPRRPAQQSPREYLDFDHAVELGQTPRIVRYGVALKPAAARLVPVDKLEVEITVDRATQSIERVTAALSEPMNVAFGLAQVTDIALDVRFDPAPDPAGPREAGPDAVGQGRATLTKFGDRAEYTWSDFTRVPAAAPTPAGAR